MSMAKNKINKKWTPFILVVFLCVFYAINNYVWLKLNQFPPLDGQAYHLEASLDCYEIIAAGSKNIFQKAGQLCNYIARGFYPPLFHILVALNNLIFGRGILVSVMTNICFIIITFFSIYFLGRKIEDRKLGVLAAFIFSMYPIVFWLSRVPLLETALSSSVVASMACLVYTENFARRRPSILLGLFIAMGMLIKQVFIFYFIGPFLFIALQSLLMQNSQASKKKLIVNILFSLGIAGVITVFWYLPKITFLWSRYIHAGYFEDATYNIPVFTFKSLIFYIHSLFFQQILPFFSILFFLSIKPFVLSGNRYKNFLIIWIVASWIIFTLIGTKVIFYTVPVLPAVALISAKGLLVLKNRFAKVFLIFLWIIFGFWQYFTISFGNEKNLVIRDDENFYLKAMNKGLACYSRPYVQRGDWKVERLFELIESQRAEGSKVTVLITYLSGDFLDQHNIGWEDRYKLLNFDLLRYMIKSKGLPYRLLSFSDYKKDYRNLPSVDFIISLMEIEDLEAAVPGKYDLLDTIIMPDKGLVYIYKNEKSH
jgi:hypothetical protein